MTTPIYITWLNYLGGFDYFMFTAKKEFSVNVESTGISEKNILPEWPYSYGPNADTIRRQTYRNSRRRITIRSQHLTQNQRDALVYIRTSPLVQILNSRTDRRTVIVDDDSFIIYDENDELYIVQFNIEYTDEIPSQRV